MYFENVFKRTTKEFNKIIIIYFLNSDVKIINHIFLIVITFQKITFILFYYFNR